MTSTHINLVLTSTKIHIYQVSTALFKVSYRKKTTYLHHISTSQLVVV